MRHHVAHTESQFFRLAAMGSGFKESLKVAILLSSVSNHEELVPTSASINTLKEETATWEYVKSIFIEENKRLRNTETNTRENMDWRRVIWRLL